MSYINIEGCKLYYECHGDAKEVLIMLHGNGEDGTYFKEQITYFVKQYRVIVMDMRGHGKSEPGELDLDFTLFAQDVVRLMDELEIEKAHILGFSDGGNTAIHIGLLYPQRVTSLILNGADLNPKGIKRHIQIPIICGFAILSLFHSAKARHKQQVMQLMVHHPDIKAEALRMIQQPVLVLVGDKDMVKDEHSALIANALPHASLVTLHGSHFIAHDCPAEYNAAVEHFLNKCK